MGLKMMIKKEANYFVVHWSELSSSFATVTSKIAFAWEAVVFTHTKRKLKKYKLLSSPSL